MPINSMTGFARVDGANAQGQWYWELRTVNGKGLDVRCRLPSSLDGFEQKVRAAVQNHLRRGNCQISLQLTRERGVGELKVNDEALSQVVSLLSELSNKVDAAPARLDGLLHLKGVVEFVEPEETEEERASLSETLLDSLEEALNALVAMRAAEGAKLGDLLSNHLDEIERLTIAARDCPARTVEAIQTRLSEQVAKLIDANATLDPERLHQEAVLIAAKADIQEELDRLFAHVEAARALLKGDEPVGRKLDFLTQEFNREANTLCSKSNDQALTAIGLDLKAVVDQMREQVQNVE